MEDNKLIAEFMGSKHPTIEDMYRLPHEDVYWGELQYDYSWDWLMPVVQKIETMGCEVVHRVGDCNIYKIDEEENYRCIIDIQETDKLRSTYKAVIKFIKDYNNGKN
jgi:hypothetical protein